MHLNHFILFYFSHSAPAILWEESYLELWKVHILEYFWTIYLLILFIFFVLSIQLIDSFNKYLLSTYWASGTVCSKCGNISGNKIYEELALLGLYTYLLHK